MMGRLSTAIGCLGSHQLLTGLTSRIDLIRWCITKQSLLNIFVLCACVVTWIRPFASIDTTMDSAAASGSLCSVMI